MLCTYLCELLLTAMIINELQALTAITSKKLQPLNTHKLTNIQLAAQLNSQCTVITLWYSQSKKTLQHADCYTSPVALENTSNYYTSDCQSASSLNSPPFLLPSPCLSFSLPSLLLFKSLFLISTSLSSHLSPLLYSLITLSLCFRSLWGQKPCMKNEMTSIRWPWQWCINPHQLGSDSSP